jgi:hypothetical protein
MESMQWKHKPSPIRKKFRVEKSAGKVMTTVFWDEKGLLLLEFMPQKTTIIVTLSKWPPGAQVEREPVHRKATY